MELIPSLKMRGFALHLLRDQLIKNNKAGIVVPSFSPFASKDMKNLVLWKWGDSAHQIKVIDDHHQLPKNQNSWL